MRSACPIARAASWPATRPGVARSQPGRSRIDHWITRSNPADLLSVDIFFDLRAVHGDGGLAVAVRQAAFAAAEGQVAFAKLLVDGISIPTSLKFFGGIRTEAGRIDLKAAGLFGLVAAARAMAIRYHVMDRSTPARLAGVKARVQVSETDIDALDEAQSVFLDLIVAQQIEDIVHGTPPSNAVSVKRLSARDRDRLQMALRAVTAIDALTRDLCSTSDGAKSDDREFPQRSRWAVRVEFVPRLLRCTNGRVNRFAAWQHCALACDRRGRGQSAENPLGRPSTKRSRVCRNRLTRNQ